MCRTGPKRTPQGRWQREDGDELAEHARGHDNCRVNVNQGIVAMTLVLPACLGYRRCLWFQMVSARGPETEATKMAVVPVEPGPAGVAEDPGLGVDT